MHNYSPSSAPRPLNKPRKKKGKTYPTKRCVNLGRRTDGAAPKHHRRALDAAAHARPKGVGVVGGEFVEGSSRGQRGGLRGAVGGGVGLEGGEEEGVGDGLGVGEAARGGEEGEEHGGEGEGGEVHLGW